MSECIDVVEVVRCKDCKFWDKDHIEKWPYSREDRTLVDFAECKQWSDQSDLGECILLRFNDYCSYGERKEENE